MNNETLNFGSIQLFFVTKVHTDITNDSIGFSQLALTAPNADYDGDALYACAIKEMDEVEKFMSIHPSQTLLGGNNQEIQNSINPSLQNRIALDQFINDSDQFDQNELEEYEIYKEKYLV